MEYKQIKKAFNSLKNGVCVEDTCKTLGITSEELFGLIEFMRLEGFEVNIVEEDKKLVVRKKSNIKKEKHIKDNMEDLEEVNLCIVSDTHLCSVVQQLTLLNNVYQEAYNRGITTVLHCGDLVDGDYSKIRPDHVYAIFARGFDEQAEYSIDMYPEIKGTTTYFIEGSHDDSHYKNGGATIGKWITKERPDMQFVGVDEYLFKAGKNKNLDILMKHPGGGIAKGYSYKLQEAINKMPSGGKPKILLQGHYHKSYYMFYRNVHAFSLPCLCAKSAFMTRMDIPNIVGAYFLKIYINKKGEIQYIEPEEYLFNESQIKEDDYQKCRKLTIK